MLLTATTSMAHPSSNNAAPWHHYSQPQPPQLPSLHSYHSTPAPPQTTHKITASATGKKRKRLQKACEACHRAKRRCDGGLPCSNCDFSGRTCCYSETTNTKVLRTNNTTNTRASPSSPSTPHSPVNSTSAATDCPTDRARAFSNASNPPSYSSIPVIDWPSPERRRELINVFFTQIHPFNAVIDEMSFLRDLSTSQVDPALLLSILAIAAIFQSAGQRSPSATAALDVAEHHARTARHLLVTENSHGMTPVDMPTLDTAQTFCFLAAYEIYSGRNHRASLYMASSIRTARALAMSWRRDAPAPPSATEQSSRVRLLAVTLIMDVVVSTLAGQVPLAHDEETRAVVDLAGPSSSHFNLPHLARAVNNFVHVLAARRSGSLDGDTRRQCEERLEAWTDSLPSDVVFTTSALGTAGSILNESADHISRSTSPHAQMSAWSFAMMHALHSCSRLLLDGPSVAGHPESPAHGDVLILLDAVRENGRRSLLALLPTLFSSHYSVRISDAAQRWTHEACAAWNVAPEQLPALIARLCVLGGGGSDRPGALAPMHFGADRALPAPHPAYYPQRSPSQEMHFATAPAPSASSSSAAARHRPSPASAFTLPSLRLPHSPPSGDAPGADSKSPLPRLAHGTYTDLLPVAGAGTGAGPTSPRRPTLPPLGRSIDSFPQPLHAHAGHAMSYTALAHGGSERGSPPTFHGRRSPPGR